MFYIFVSGACAALLIYSLCAKDFTLAAFSAVAVAVNFAAGYFL